MKGVALVFPRGFSDVMCDFTESFFFSEKPENTTTYSAVESARKTRECWTLADAWASSSVDPERCS